MKIDFQHSVSRARHKKERALSNVFEKKSAFYLFIYKFYGYKQCLIKSFFNGLKSNKNIANKRIANKLCCVYHSSLSILIRKQVLGRKKPAENFRIWF